VDRGMVPLVVAFCRGRRGALEFGLGRLLAKESVSSSRWRRALPAGLCRAGGLGTFPLAGALSLVTARSARTSTVGLRGGG
jgi:hypothetical protein